MGAGGRLGAALVREYASQHEVTGFTHAQLDLGRTGGFAVRRLSPCPFDVLINAAALTNVDYCEDHREEAMRLNAEAPRVLAEICREKDRRFIHVSTDYVFDGEKRQPYTETDPAHAISVYGESKRDGELRVLEANGSRPGHSRLVGFRAGSTQFCGCDSEKSADRGSSCRGCAISFQPRPIPTILRRCCGGCLIHRRADGILHLANRGACSWQEYAQWALDCCHEFGVPMKAKTVGAVSLGEMKNFVARRPVYTVLGTEKYERLAGVAPRDWRVAVADYVRDHYRR